MRKLLAFAFAVMFASAAFAQTAAPTNEPVPVCYWFKDNTLMKCSATSTSNVDVPMVTLNDGTTVTVKGAITRKSGKRLQMVNGQCIDMAGKLGKCATICTCLAPPPPPPTEIKAQ